MPNTIEKAREVIRIEAKAVAALEDRIGERFREAVDVIFRAKGRVIVTGMGKSGIIGKKIAATLTSTGTPAFYLHPAEGMHGDLGMVRRDDVVIAISKSGETDELYTLLPLFKRLGVPIIAMTGRSTSPLAQGSDIVLDIGVEREACPYDLAPTASTTVTLVLGDALAIALLHKRNFSEEDFAFLHPGGSLGRKLLCLVEDVMYKGDAVPIVSTSTAMRDVILEMTSKALGITCVVDASGVLTGVLTDGDLRRLLERVRGDVLSLDAGEALLRSSRSGKTRGYPRTIGPKELAAKAVQVMEKHVITELVVTDPSKKPIGIVKWIDLSKLGVV
ncbi:MAG: D-arabinose 5-phosphate isomerase [Candidatus Latescibacteria bacterium 4484_107]|nr:MAG: D-arabinose 5-phosphate isomerase [Candidatus Latescibacteria bacterium 4484_107]